MNYITMLTFEIKNLNPLISKSMPSRKFLRPSPSFNYLKANYRNKIHRCTFIASVYLSIVSSVSTIYFHFEARPEFLS